MNDPYVAEAYLGPCQIYVIDMWWSFFAKIVNQFSHCFFLQESFIIDVWQGTAYVRSTLYT